MGFRCFNLWKHANILINLNSNSDVSTCLYILSIYLLFNIFLFINVNFLLGITFYKSVLHWFKIWLNFVSNFFFIKGRWKLTHSTFQYSIFISRFLLVLIHQLKKAVVFIFTSLLLILLYLQRTALSGSGFNRILFSPGDCTKIYLRTSIYMLDIKLLFRILLLIILIKLSNIFCHEIYMFFLNNNWHFC